jgi:endonuclease/exonuclease/phosphatase family metal-dependent hydrolase
VWTQLGGRLPATTVGTVTAWTVATLVVIAAFIRLLGLERGALLVQLVSFTPYAALAALFGAVAAALGRRWWPAVLAGLATVTLAVTVAPRGFGSLSTEPGVPLTVMSVNMRLGGADASSIVDLVRVHGADVLAVQELTQDGLDNLDAAGLAQLMPHREVHAGSRAAGSALYSRFPLTEAGDRVASPRGYRQAYALVQVPGVRPVRVESVHTVPPIDDEDTSRWADGLRAQPTASESPGILAGDFNATLDHQELRRLLDTGYRDAAAEVGAGMAPTWPFYGRRSWVTPRITLDHVLVPDGVHVRGFTAVTVARTDHRAIIATLTLSS